MAEFKDIAGQRFGRLIAIRRDGIPRPVRWLCECDCGTKKIIRQNNLAMGKTKSCGCQANAKITKHGRWGDRTYKTWNMLTQRCRNSKFPFYKNYGGRGITVCDRWLDFSNFLADMGERPEHRWIDRIDNDRGYEPGNCRWATYSESNSNKRNMKKDGQKRDPTTGRFA